MGNTYITKQGDTWDIISREAYGDEKYADYLMQNNFSLLDMCIFSAGVEVTIPALPEFENEDLPDWRL